MKLKQLKLRPSAVCMTEAEMKNVIGGIQSTSNELVCPVGSVCYEGHYQGTYEWETPPYGGTPRCICYYVPTYV